MTADREPFAFLGAELASVDNDVDALIDLEEARQANHIILIPSESIAPRAVRQALGSVFTNIYAEGYPSLRMTRDEERMLQEFEQQLAYHRRYADRRYYKGTEFANFVESLAQRRVAELFATDRDPGAAVSVRPDQIFANVQPLSGAAANNAVYEALLQPGDTVLGMSLTHGGHLTHGSPLNRSGRYYKVVSYTVSDPKGPLNYDDIARLAQEHKPRMIIGGASAYPWDIDWKRLREIADSVPGRAYLMADIAHPCGLVVAGLFPNPVGLADAVTFTTHKTMLGPRAAVILSTDEKVARCVDRAVFPGEQGGPHINSIAAMAVAFKLAQTPEFRRLQERTVENAQALARALQRLGLSLAYGGTNTHLLLVNLNAVKTSTGYPLKGDVAARILDVCGIVCNKNTIPGDSSAADASAIRMGTTWITQQGFRTAQIEKLAELIYETLSSIRTFRYVGASGDLARGKLPIETIKAVKRGVAGLLSEAGVAQPETSRALAAIAEGSEVEAGSDLGTPDFPIEGRRLLQVTGERAFFCLQGACTANLAKLGNSQWCWASLLDSVGAKVDDVAIFLMQPDSWGRDRYRLSISATQFPQVKDWLEALSDGFVVFDNSDIYRKIDGPVVVQEIPNPRSAAVASVSQPVTPQIDLSKPYFVGCQQALQTAGQAAPNKQPHSFEVAEGEPRPTCLYAEHLKLAAKRNIIPFAGWLLPVWYTSIGDEHKAVRESAGLFDISHMGVMEIGGAGATRFLDLVSTNYVPALAPGQAQYSYLLDPEGAVIDDIFVYKRAAERYMVVVNAVNAAKVIAWLRAVAARACIIDHMAPHREMDVTVSIRDLKDPSSGADQRVDLAIQGPRSAEILSRVADPATRALLPVMPRSSFVEARIEGLYVMIARTGYTGEDVGFETYVHPGEAPRLWNLLLESGRSLGLKPAGLGARDSCRTEAGFPLYGHELAGPHGISPTGAGYGSFVKLHKAFFIGRDRFIQQEASRKSVVVRFQLNSRGVRMVHPGDPVVNRRGEYAGKVTSCSAVEGLQVGMAYVTQSVAREGTTIGIFTLPHDGKPAIDKDRRDLRAGDKALLHEEATVISRFMTVKSEG